MNLVDSCGWLEYFADGPNAEQYAAPIEAGADLLVPSLVVYEVFKVIARQRGQTQALQAVAHVQTGRVVDLDSTLALEAARLGAEHGLPLADAVIYATACQYDATVWTQDQHFAELPRVRYVPSDSAGS